MSDFVDYNKRSVTLPPGCKDLIDVLRPHGFGVEWLRQHPGVDLSRTVRRGGIVKGALSDIEKRVSRAVTSNAQPFVLVIAPVDGRLTFNLLRVFKGALRATINVETKTPHAAAVQQFLSNHHLQPPDDSPSPEPFLPNLPVHLICPVCPLPSDVIALAKLASDLFREVSGVTEESELTFYHHELDAPGS
jgi:hypothetical protein